MEMLTQIYPYTLYLLYALSAFACILLFILFIKVLGAHKALKLTLSPVSSIESKIETIQSTTDTLSKDIKQKNSQLQQFLKKFGLFVAAWHIFFPKKDKRRR